MSKQITYGDAVAPVDPARRQPPGRRREGDAGPRGRNVVLDKKFGSPLITKDGVTVAREIELKDRSRTWARRW
jgi:hypothetical protein